MALSGLKRFHVNHFTDSEQVVIDTSQLVAGKDYLVRILTDKGLWMIPLSMNQPPTGGYCDVIPKEGKRNVFRINILMDVIGF